MDIILHCLDPGHLKAKPLNEVFPAICRFNQVCFMKSIINYGIKIQNNRNKMNFLKTG